MKTPQEKLIELVEEGWLAERQALLACMKYMNVDQVKEMVELNEFDAVWKDYEEWTHDGWE